jgi:hypothetical protein
MNNWFYVFIPIVVVLIWLYSRRSKANSSSSHKRSSKASNKRTSKTGKKPDSKISKNEADYRAVSIQLGPQACRAARYLRDKKFLSTKAPALPLAECISSDCQCKYVYYSDRRDEDERRFPSHIMDSVFSDKEKREKSKSERRKK